MNGIKFSIETPKIAQPVINPVWAINYINSSQLIGMTRLQQSQCRLLSK